MVSLRDYLKASPCAKNCQPIIDYLEKQDIDVPVYMRHTAEFCRLQDETRYGMSKDALPAEGDRVWGETYERRYPGLTAQQRDKVIEEFQAPSAVVVNEHNYPRLNALFHALCDEMNVKNSGPNGNDYPTLVLAKSDTCSAGMNSKSLGGWRNRDDVTIFVSEAEFNNSSNAMAATTLIHELWHASKRQMPLMMDFIYSVIPPDFGRIREEFGADAAPKRLGMAGETVADSLMETAHHDMKRLAFARQMKQMLDQVMPNLENDWQAVAELPMFLRVMINDSTERLHLHDQGSRWQRLMADTKAGHPTDQRRVERVLKGEPLDHGWRTRFEQEFARGDLLAKPGDGTGR